MVFKFIQVFLLASVKYLLTVPYALIIGIDFTFAFSAILLGGITGFLFFYYLGNFVKHAVIKMRSLFCTYVPLWFKNIFNCFCVTKLSPKRILFSSGSRFLVKFKNNFGFWGIVISTPVLLSIPVGAFLANRYYSKRKKVVLYMLLSIFCWGIVFAGILQLFPAVIN